MTHLWIGKQKYFTTWKLSDRWVNKCLQLCGQGQFKEIVSLFQELFHDYFKIRDTLFQYFMLLEAYASNADERDYILKILGEFDTKIHQIF
jgi:hypothetical protein